MAEYQKYGLVEYLDASIHHQMNALRTLGRFAGRMRHVEREWKDEYDDEYKLQLHKSNLRPEVNAYDRRMRAVLEPKEWDQIVELVRRYVGLVEEGPSPAVLLRKVGTVSYGLSRTTSDCLREAMMTRARVYGEPFPAIAEPAQEFLREFADYSGISFADASVPDEWKRPYSEKHGTIDWEENVFEVVRKIDFNLKRIAKGIAVICGVAVCIVGACGKITSVVTVNLPLNVISMNAMFAGAALAVKPEKAVEIIESLAGGKSDPRTM